MLDAALYEMLHDRTLEPIDVVDILFMERALSLPWWLRRFRDAGGLFEALVVAALEYV